MTGRARPARPAATPEMPLQTVSPRSATTPCATGTGASGKWTQPPPCVWSGVGPTRRGTRPAPAPAGTAGRNRPHGHHNHNRKTQQEEKT